MGMDSLQNPIQITISPNLESMIEKLDNKREEIIVSYKLHATSYPGLGDGGTFLVQSFNLKWTSFSFPKIIRTPG